MRHGSRIWGKPRHTHKGVRFGDCPACGKFFQQRRKAQEYCSDAYARRGVRGSVDSLTCTHECSSRSKGLIWRSCTEGDRSM